MLSFHFNRKQSPKQFCAVGLISFYSFAFLFVFVFVVNCLLWQFSLWPQSKDWFNTHLGTQKTEKASSSNTLVQFMNNFVTFHLCKLGRIAPNNPLVLEQFAIWIEIEKELKLYFCNLGEIFLNKQTVFSEEILPCKVTFQNKIRLNQNQINASWNRSLPQQSARC